MSFCTYRTPDSVTGIGESGHAIRQRCPKQMGVVNIGCTVTGQLVTHPICRVPDAWLVKLWVGSTRWRLAVNPTSTSLVPAPECWASVDSNCGFESEERGRGRGKLSRGLRGSGGRKQAFGAWAHRLHGPRVWRAIAPRRPWASPDPTSAPSSVVRSRRSGWLAAP
jgi:hypothetical protein